MLSFVHFLRNNLTVQLLAGGLAFLTLLNVTFKSWKALRKIGFYPGLRTIVGPESAVCDLVVGGYVPYVCAGRSWAMTVKHEIFKQFNQDVMSWFQIYPSIRSYFIVSDPYAVKEIVSNRSRFPKYTPTYKVLNYFGSNILTTEGEEWKHQRKLTAPAFSEKNNRLVWDETVRIIAEMFDSWGRENKEIPINHCLDITLPITLMAISAAGFGRRISWVEDTSVPPGYKMSFKNALHIVSCYIIYIVFFPKWVFSLTETLRNAYLAKDELVTYLKEMIEQRRVDLSEERHDLFTALLKVNEVSTKDEGKLAEEELLGNIFIFLLAGHETTAHTMCFALGLLAIEQEEQEKLYQHIVSILGDRDVPNYEEFNALSYVMATINETLRLFPPVAIIPKVTEKDEIIPFALPDGGIGALPIQAGTEVYINAVIARYWKEPHTFDPSRFLRNYNRDAFLPFSGGARACIGRGFAETEMVAALTMIVRKYKVEVKNPELYAGMSKIEQREKLLASRGALTLTPINVPVIFRKRML